MTRLAQTLGSQLHKYPQMPPLARAIGTHKSLGLGLVGDKPITATSSALTSKCQIVAKTNRRAARQPCIKDIAVTKIAHKRS